MRVSRHQPTTKMSNSTEYDYQSDILKRIADIKSDIRWVKDGGSLDKIENALEGIFPPQSREEALINLLDGLAGYQGKLITLMRNNIL